MFRSAVVLMALLAVAKLSDEMMRLVWRLGVAAAIDLKMRQARGSGMDRLTSRFPHDRPQQPFLDRGRVGPRSREARRFLSAAEADEWFALWPLLLYSGMPLAGRELPFAVAEAG